MIKEAFVADRALIAPSLRLLPKCLQRRQSSITALRARDPAAIDGNADRGQTEAHRSNAARRVGRAAIFDQAVAGIGLLPEEIERGVLQKIEENAVLRRRRGFKRPFLCERYGGEEQN